MRRTRGGACATSRCRSCSTASRSPTTAPTPTTVLRSRAPDVTEAELDELENFGLIKPFYDDGIRAFYDRDALVCVRAAAVLAKHGVQPRHLKMYVHFTEREAALFHQVLAPYLRQRNPVSRARVDETIIDLVGEARALRGALLRRAIDDALGE